MTPVTETKPVGQRLAPQDYPSLAQGVMPLPPKHSDDAMVLDHCLDVLQALTKSDVAEAASEATEQRVVASDVARADAEGTQWVHIFAGSQCVGSAVSTSMEQPSRNALEQQDGARLSRVCGPQGSPYDEDEPPPSPCLMQ